MSCRHQCSDCISPVATPVVTTTYTVEILTHFGCVIQDNILVNVLPTPIVDATVNPVDANGLGSIGLDVSGGAPPYTYQWYN